MQERPLTFGATRATIPEEEDGHRDGSRAPEKPQIQQSRTILDDFRRSISATEILKGQQLRDARRCRTINQQSA